MISFNLRQKGFIKSQKKINFKYQIFIKKFFKNNFANKFYDNYQIK